jgi:hypothetical protein
LSALDQRAKQRSERRFYSSPSSSPALDVGAPPNIDGTPAGGAALDALPRAPDARFAADRPGFAALGAAFLAGFLEPFLAPPAFLAAERFLPPLFFLAVLPADFFAVFVFFAAFFLAAIRNPPAEVVTTATAELPHVGSAYGIPGGRAT